MTNLKRPPKKRRKKKPSSANPNSSNSSSGTGTLLTTINGNSDHRGSTDSGENEKNNVLQAITILQRSEGQQANGFSEEPLDSTTEPAENSAEMEDSEEILDDDQTPDPNAEHVNDEPVEPEQDQRVTEIEAEIIPEDAKILVRLFIIIVIVHSFLTQCFARSLIGKICWYLQLMSTEFSLKIS